MRPEKRTYTTTLTVGFKNFSTAPNRIDLDNASSIHLTWHRDVLDYWNPEKKISFSKKFENFLT